MKTMILTATLAAFSFGAAAPVQAAFVADGLNTLMQANTSIDKRSKPRVKGGSGCDTAADIIQHPACR